MAVGRMTILGFACPRPSTTLRPALQRRCWKLEDSPRRSVSSSPTSSHELQTPMTTIRMAVGDALSSQEEFDPSGPRG